MLLLQLSKEQSMNYMLQWVERLQGKHFKRRDELYVPQVVQHKACKNSDSSSQDLRPGKHAISLTNKSW